MQPIYLTEGDVVETFPMREALIRIEDAARALAEGRAQNRPRQRAQTDSAMIHVLVGAYGGRLGNKTYTVSKARGARFLVSLFGQAGELLALIEADALGQIRTGAASGVATRVLAREDAATLAIIGTGWQARSQVEACVRVRPIRRVLVYGRDPARRAAFCEQMSERIDVPLEAVESARDAIAQADVVCTMTSSTHPVLEGAWLRPGTHVNAAGSNRAHAQEVDVETVRRAGVIAVEDVAQAHVESGDLLAAEREGWSWDRATLLSDVVANLAPARTDERQITLFESLGIGLWDIAAAGYVYDVCVAEGRGTPLPIPA
ncbi:MAG TPA: ornithine cyclodeaminase family protein [Candidatus Sulfotelmatobacter sp.]|nr:ornithine cyclodeaminase family protein [Candidatus Sulfotelmatobacter sp.]